MSADLRLRDLIGLSDEQLDARLGPPDHESSDETKTTVRTWLLAWDEVPCYVSVAAKPNDRRMVSCIPAHPLVAFRLELVLSLLGVNPDDELPGGFTADEHGRVSWPYWPALGATVLIDYRHRAVFAWPGPTVDGGGGLEVEEVQDAVARVRLVA